MIVKQVVGFLLSLSFFRASGRF